MLSPGSRIVKQPDGKFLVHGNRFEFTPDQYTSDRKTADDLRAKEAQRQDANNATTQQGAVHVINDSMSQ